MEWDRLWMEPPILIIPSSQMIIGWAILSGHPKLFMLIMFLPFHYSYYLDWFRLVSLEIWKKLSEILWLLKNILGLFVVSFLNGWRILNNGKPRSLRQYFTSLVLIGSFVSPIFGRFFRSSLDFKYFFGLVGKFLCRPKPTKPIEINFQMDLNWFMRE